MEVILKYFDAFSDIQKDQLHQLKDLYRYWNDRINVISRKDIDALYERHVLHSLSIAAVNPFIKGNKVLDIGTGGGFPGIPLAVFYPEVNFVLVDSIGKKISVVQEIANSIQLKNVKAMHTRVENLNETSFDFVISRAVAPLQELWKWAKPLIKKGENRNGLICLKGGDLAKEISDSEVFPKVFPIRELFKEPFFEEKYLLWIER